MYNHNKAQQSKNRVHISWDILYIYFVCLKLNTSQEHFCRRTFFGNTGLDLFPRNFLVSNLHSHLEQFMGVFQILLLAIITTFGAVE